MKNAIFTAFKILIALVLIGKLLNWFLDFSDGTNELLNRTMFTLIGTAYMVTGYFWDVKRIKIVIMLCGAFLIAMNFFNNSLTLDIIGIVCLLTPMLIARFNKTKHAQLNLPES